MKNMYRASKQEAQGPGVQLTILKNSWNLLVFFLERWKTYHAGVSEYEI
jgi:hypothetical protein